MRATDITIMFEVGKERYGLERFSETLRNYISKCARTKYDSDTISSARMPLSPL